MEIDINLCIQVLNEIDADLIFSFFCVYITDVSSCNLSNFEFNYNLTRGCSSVPTWRAVVRQQAVEFRVCVLENKISVSELQYCRQYS
jgi:hypothetical protein